MENGKHKISYLLKRVLRFAVLPVVVILAIETGARIFHIPKISHNNIDAKAQQVMAKIDSNTVLIVGDSRLEWGLQPVVMQQKLNDKNIQVLNLAMPGSNGLDVLQYLVRHKIKVKAIIAGVTPNFGRYENHKLQSIHLSFRNRLFENTKYKARQYFYTLDNSISNYIENGYPYFKTHQYDEQGGAVVFEYGNYTKRCAFQENMYSKWSENFQEKQLLNYTKTLNGLIDSLAMNAVPVYGIYMPVSRKLFALEKINKERLEQQIDFHSYSDYSGFVYADSTGGHDSTYFYDGSHLSHNYAKVFSAILAAHLNELRKNEK